MKKMTFVAALKDYFGYLPGQMAGGFLQELKKLTDKDKEDYKKMLATVGYEIVASA